ncbi:Na+/H+ antiporter [Cellulomonas septica]|uniref:Na+/H+ antiporter n=1 Tax=Cellulomonas septica TaxID=285080 RepID=A0ABX1JWA2_9CELL|nr:Na+/H+ antiporter [Cellulomonas septica]NKY38070.1 Na+/H+ antiporter [Cellulomonas septica]
MSAVVVAVLLAGVVALTPLADRLRVPLPVLLTVFGLLVPLVPAVPSPRIEPDVILPLVLPPLLFAATQRATARDFRQNVRPIAFLAVGLTVVTAAVVALVAHAAGLPWGPAAVLGAVVAPPDPVAATAVARRLRLPGRLVTVLEGEGMFNDATALVMYNVAVAAVVAGEFSASGLGVDLLLAVGLGVALGLAFGVVTRAALARLHLAAPETTVTLAAPFVVYLLAEHLGGSGVLAVLALGLYLRTYGHRAITSGGWLLGRAVWRYADYIVTSLVFVFIGFELTAVLEEEQIDGATVGLAALVVVVLVAVRFVWIMPTTRFTRLWPDPTDASALGPREGVVASWAGMRGVVTVATALAVPASTAAGADFPDRHTIVFVGLVAVLATLVVQGLTLAPLVTWLRVGTEADVAAEARALRRRATDAALTALRDGSLSADVPDAARRAVTVQYEGYLAAQDALVDARAAVPDGSRDENTLDDLLRRAAEVERDLVVDARSAGDVSPEAADEVLDDIESRAVRDSD